jgi:hypothetical protein
LWFFSVYYRQRAKFSKATAIWTTTTVKATKPYSYIPAMCRDVVMAHLESDEPLRTKRVQDQDDPRRIQKTLTNVPRPSKEAMAEQRAAKSRKIPWNEQILLNRSDSSWKLYDWGMGVWLRLMEWMLI